MPPAAEHHWRPRQIDRDLPPSLLPKQRPSAADPCFRPARLPRRQQTFHRRRTTAKATHCPHQHRPPPPPDPLHRSPAIASPSRLSPVSSSRASPPSAARHHCYRLASASARSLAFLQTTHPLKAREHSPELSEPRPPRWSVWRTVKLHYFLPSRIIPLPTPAVTRAALHSLSLTATTASPVGCSP